MVEIDYSSLTNTQKIAGFFIVIGAEAAAEMMKHFDSEQLEAICREMTTLNVIDKATQDKLLAEFTDVISAGMGNVFGGVSYAQLALEKTGHGGADSGIFSRIFPSRNAGDGGNEIQQMTAKQIVSLVKLEQPQTIAFILSCIETSRAAEVVKELSAELREDVVERLGAIGETTSDMAAKISRQLGRHLEPGSAQVTMTHSDGVKAAAEILNALDKETRRTMLLHIEERNADLGAAIRKKIFGFEEITKLALPDLQRVLREVDMRDLAMALKNAKPAQLAVFCNGMSKRAARGLKDEIDMLPPQKPKMVAEAQGKILQIVLKLEAAEEITLEPEKEEDELLA